MATWDYGLEQVAGGEGIRGRAVFGRDFFAFEGHFPDYPMLPGFVQIQTALDLLTLAGRGAKLAAVRGAKFMAPIGPEQAVMVEVMRVSATEVGVTMRVEGRACSRFELILRKKGRRRSVENTSFVLKRSWK